MPSARIFRVIVPVPNIDEAAAYYSAILDNLGARISPNRHYFGCGQSILCCLDPQDTAGSWAAQESPHLLYFAVDDLDACFTRVSAQPAGSILHPIETQPWGERSFYCKDPFGNKLCFVDDKTCFTGGQM